MRKKVFYLCEKMKLHVLIFSSFLAFSKLHGQCNQYPVDLASLYDTACAGFHSSIAKMSDGKVYVWGQNLNMITGSIGSYTSPLLVQASNGFTGVNNANILKFTIGSTSTDPYGSQIAIVESGVGFIKVFGSPDVLITNNVGNAVANPSQNYFTVAYPAGVTANDVRMFFGTVGTLVLVTKTKGANNGEVYVLSKDAVMRGTGITTGGTDNTWSKVTIGNGTTFLTKIVAVRGMGGSAGGTYNVLFAHDENNNLYTWGRTTYTGGVASATNSRAVQISKNVKGGGAITESIRMIAANFPGSTPVYYVVTQGGKLYFLGNQPYSSYTPAEERTWTLMTATGLSNVKFISSSEHVDDYSSTNIINASNLLYAWGSNDNQMIGTTGNAPAIPSGLTTASSIRFVETGGHITMAQRTNTTNFCYVGHAIDYSNAYDSGDITVTSYTCPTNPPVYSFCSLGCYNAATTTGTALATNHGITALGRAGAQDNDNWPMTRNGAWTALEAKTKGFVINRMPSATANVGTVPNYTIYKGEPLNSTLNAAVITVPIKGMMYYDTTDNCLKINTDATRSGWKCFNNQGCPGY